MSVFNNDDLTSLVKNMDNLTERIERKLLEVYEPNDKERKEVTAFILKFVKDNKRKIYGGYALNKLIEGKDKKDLLYKDYQTPDIDFYSPTPIEDLINLCNLLHKAGFKKVNAKEAVHKETYTIFVNYQLYCDISYVPRNIYNKMPFKDINGINYIHPFFMAIDYLRMVTDPLESYWRIEKSVKRMILLQKHYPLPKIDKPIEISNSTSDLDKAVDIVTEVLTTRKTCITVGFYAYNYFVNQHKSNKNINVINVPYHEIITSDYKADFDYFMMELKKVFDPNHDSNRITHKEYFPFFQFVGYSVEILLDGEVIAVLYSNNKKCLPLQIVPALEFKNGTAKELKDKKIYLGTFSLTVLFAQIMTIRYRVMDDKDMMNVYMTFVSHLIMTKEQYLKKNNKSIFDDDTIFKDFVVECIGAGINPMAEKSLAIEAKLKKGKPAFYKYEPGKDMKTPDSNFSFSNSSGNEIKNPKNLKLTENYNKNSLDSESEPEPETETDTSEVQPSETIEV